MTELQASEIRSEEVILERIKNMGFGDNQTTLQVQFDIGSVG